MNYGKRISNGELTIITNLRNLLHKRMARLREYILESKWAINFISKLIYWFNFLLIYFLNQGRKPSFLLVEDW